MNKPWNIITNDIVRIIQIYLLEDIIGHTINFDIDDGNLDDCVCNPDVDFVKLYTMITHNAFDGRE